MFESCNMSIPEMRQLIADIEKAIDKKVMEEFPIGTLVGRMCDLFTTDKNSHVVIGHKLPFITIIQSGCMEASPVNVKPETLVTNRKKAMAAKGITDEDWLD